jgi:hypothetical protein
MKRSRTAASFALLFSAIFASMVVLTTTALGDTKHITLHQPVMVGTVMLKEGDYSIKWDGVGPEVTVTFKRNGDTVATAPARLVMEKNPNRRSIETASNADDSRILTKIAFSKEALVFDQGAATGESK